LIFTLLHEIAHIGHGDVDGVTPEASPDIYLSTVRTVELMTYGGTGKNRHVRFREYDADREAACWLSQRTIKRMLDEPTHDFGVAHLGLASFGMLMVLLHLSRHDADTQEMMQSFDHPSYDVRLEGAWEGITTPLEDTLTVASAANIEQMITCLRQLIETVIFGEPSKYVISMH